MANDTCSVGGCLRPRWAGGLCGSHYSAVRRSDGLIGAPLRQRRGSCSVDGCEGKHQARGLCDMHYRRWRDYGDPLVVGRPGPKPGQNTGPANPQWKGANCGYQALHLRLVTERGGADSHLCPCGKPATGWSYDHSDPEPIISPQGWPYSLDSSRYDPLCSSCHSIRDHRAVRSPSQ